MATITSYPVPTTTAAGAGHIIARFPDGSLLVSHPKPKTDAEREIAGSRWLGGPCWIERVQVDTVTEKV